MRRRSNAWKCSGKIFKYKFILTIGALLIILLFILETLLISSPSPVKRTQKDPIDWSDVSAALGKLSDSGGFQGIGLLNFDRDETQRWNEILPNAEHVSLDLNPVPNNVTWDTLYPEWIDEEEEFQVPVCPELPQIQFFHGIQPMDLVAVKLPCDDDWSRDVSRLHLQLEAARIAARVSEYYRRVVYVVLVTDYRPIPNLFSCKDLIVRKGNVWVYKPELRRLQNKFRVPVGSCQLAVHFNGHGNMDLSYENSGNGNRVAYATILHSGDGYVCGAIVAAQSIRLTGSTRDLVALVDQTISEYHKSGLREAGWKIYPLETIMNPKSDKHAHYAWSYSKFRLWELTEYDKIVFIDADLLILRNIDFLFRLPEMSAAGNHGNLFNSGVMVIEPSNCTFQLLMDRINDIESYDGGDQGYLNEIFMWWHRIPRRMNFLKHFWIGDDSRAQELKKYLFGADPPVLYAIQYLGIKPWLCFRDYDCNWNMEEMHQFASDAAHQTWWKVHDGMPENLQRYCSLPSKQKAALEWNRRKAEKGNYSDGHWRTAIRDPRLEMCFEEYCSWETLLRQ